MHNYCCGAVLINEVLTNAGTICAMSTVV